MEMVKRSVVAGVGGRQGEIGGTWDFWGSKLSGACVISSVLSLHNKNLKRRISITAFGRSSVTALKQTGVNSSMLQLSFI